MPQVLPEFFHLLDDVFHYGQPQWPYPPNAASGCTISGVWWVFTGSLEVTIWDSWDELPILSKDKDIIIIKFINSLLIERSNFYIQYRYKIMSCIPPVCIFFTTIPSSRFPVSPPGGDSQDRWGDPRDCCWQRVGAAKGLGFIRWWDERLWGSREIRQKNPPFEVKVNGTAPRKTVLLRNHLLRVELITLTVYIIYIVIEMPKVK